MANKKIRYKRMRDLLNYVEYKTGKSGTEIAEELKMTRQNYSQLKIKALTSRLRLLLLIKDKYKITPDQIFECLEKDL